MLKDYAPINPKTNKPYFTISSEGWTGDFTLGATITIPQPFKPECKCGKKCEKKCQH